MSMNSESLSKDPSTVQQRRQANILLLRMQWLVILLLIAALLWLYISQQRFQHSVNDRLQSNEQVISRLNEMDDRLFAMSQQTLPEPRVKASSQAQNQLDLLRIQIKAADRLLADSNDSAAIELLRGLHWQLSQSSNEIAPALTIVIKQSLIKDIERLQAQSSQPSPWQIQNLAIQNIQEFLHSHERLGSYEGTDLQRRELVDAATENKQQLKATNVADNSAASDTNLTRRQLTIHEVIMTLNLASQASNMRKQDQLVSYLTQARKQLKTLVPKASTSDNKKSAQAGAIGIVQADKKPIDGQSNLETMKAPSDIPEVIVWLNQLIAHAPKPTPLLTTEILDKPQR
ncbi:MULTISPECIES: hypothetical protein [unclassified Psychrobacter]|uniref:hypothetical protein n=1 Tax=unclassified Psychrobacter TaxID=196806 RepID=UPI000C7D11F8|nr:MULTISPECIES: hypothetical protein [unclassified Psychrobacter]PKG67103.1 hypothetical protein CXF56_04610 [Psychrobacter sp. Choline-02u-13]PKH53391.1 hypothetical protein CXF69_07320 [Psychrobacter sp. Choline-02u-9]